MSEPGTIPAERVAEVYRRWLIVDEGRTNLIAGELAGLSSSWFDKLLNGRGSSLLTLTAVDKFLTRLGLVHEWPFVMEEDEPEELAERWCRKCTRNVLADPVTSKCVWCGGGPTLLPKPLDYDLRSDPLLGRGLTCITEEQIAEAWSHYQRGYSLRQVIDIMWPRLGYAMKPTAMGCLRRLLMYRGYRLRSVAELNRARCTKHGRATAVKKGQPGFEEYAAYCHERHMEWYYQGREKCAEPDCEKYATRGAFRKRQGRNVIDSEFCRWHTPGVAAEAGRRLLERRQANEEPLGNIRPILRAWEGKATELSRRSGVHLGTVYRWMNRWDDDKLVKRSLADQVRAVGAR